VQAITQAGEVGQERRLDEKAHLGGLLCQHLALY
jgi:hypothetical protein